MSSTDATASSHLTHRGPGGEAVTILALLGAIAVLVTGMPGDMRTRDGQ